MLDWMVALRRNMVKWNFFHIGFESNVKIALEKNVSWRGNSEPIREE